MNGHTNSKMERLSINIIVAAELRRGIGVRDRGSNEHSLGKQVYHSTFLAAEALVWIALSKYASAQYLIFDNVVPATPALMQGRAAMAVIILDQLVREGIVRIVAGQRSLLSAEQAQVFCRFAVDEMGDGESSSSNTASFCAQLERARTAQSPLLDPAKASLLVSGARSAAAGLLPWWLTDGIIPGTPTIYRAGAAAASSRVTLSGGIVVEPWQAEDCSEGQGAGGMRLESDHTQWLFAPHVTVNSVALTVGLVDALQGAAHALYLCAHEQALVVGYARAMWANQPLQVQQTGLANARKLYKDIVGERGIRNGRSSHLARSALTSLNTLHPDVCERMEQLLDNRARLLGRIRRILAHVRGRVLAMALSPGVHGDEHARHRKAGDSCAWEAVQIRHPQGQGHRHGLVQAQGQKQVHVPTAALSLMGSRAQPLTSRSLEEEKSVRSRRSSRSSASGSTGSFPSQLPVFAAEGTPLGSAGAQPSPDGGATAETAGSVLPLYISVERRMDGCIHRLYRSTALFPVLGPPGLVLTHILSPHLRQLWDPSALHAEVLCHLDLGASARSAAGAESAWSKEWAWAWEFDEGEDGDGGSAGGGVPDGASAEGSEGTPLVKGHSVQQPVAQARSWLNLVGVRQGRSQRGMEGKQGMGETAPAEAQPLSPLHGFSSLHAEEGKPGLVPLLEDYFSTSAQKERQQEEKQNIHGGLTHTYAGAHPHPQAHAEEFMNRSQPQPSKVQAQRPGQQALHPRPRLIRRVNSSSAQGGGQTESTVIQDWAFVPSALGPGVPPCAVVWEVSVIPPHGASARANTHAQAEVLLDAYVLQAVPVPSAAFGTDGGAGPIQGPPSTSATSTPSSVSPPKAQYMTRVVRLCQVNGTGVGWSGLSNGQRAQSLWQKTGLPLQRLAAVVAECARALQSTPLDGGQEHTQSHSSSSGAPAPVPPLEVDAFTPMNPHARADARSYAATDSALILLHAAWTAGGLIRQPSHVDMSAGALPHLRKVHPSSSPACVSAPAAGAKLRLGALTGARGFTQRNSGRRVLQPHVPISRAPRVMRMQENGGLPDIPEHEPVKLMETPETSGGAETFEAHRGRLESILIAQGPRKRAYTSNLPVIRAAAVVTTNLDGAAQTSDCEKIGAEVHRGREDEVECAVTFPDSLAGQLTTLDAAEGGFDLGADDADAEIHAGLHPPVPLPPAGQYSDVAQDSTRGHTKTAFAMALATALPSPAMPLPAPAQPIAEQTVASAGRVEWSNAPSLSPPSSTAHTSAVGLADFQLVAVLGAGGYGRVLLVRRIRPRAYVRVQLPCGVGADGAVLPERQAVRRVFLSHDTPRDDGVLYALKVVPKVKLGAIANMTANAQGAATAAVVEAATAALDGAGAGAQLTAQMARSAHRLATERTVLGAASLHAATPFIVRLAYAFQTPAAVCLVTEYCPGGDLYTWLNRHGPLAIHGPFARDASQEEEEEEEEKFDVPQALTCMGEEAAVLLAAELVLAVASLHAHGVLYRDMKAENVLIDAQGHLKLADFGLAKLVTGALAAAATAEAEEGVGSVSAQRAASAAVGAGRRLSIAGTELYMSPELLWAKTEGSGRFLHGSGGVASVDSGASESVLPRGADGLPSALQALLGMQDASPLSPPAAVPSHLAALDWWAVGIQLAEVLTGQHPFAPSCPNNYANLPGDAPVRDGVADYNATLAGVMDAWRRPCLDVYAPHVRGPGVDAWAGAPRLSAAARDLLHQLLHRNPAQRAGSASAGGLRALMRHPFFRVTAVVEAAAKEAEVGIMGLATPSARLPPSISRSDLLLTVPLHWGRVNTLAYASRLQPGPRRSSIDVGAFHASHTRAAPDWGAARMKPSQAHHGAHPSHSFSAFSVAASVGARVNSAIGQQHGLAHELVEDVDPEALRPLQWMDVRRGSAVSLFSLHTGVSLFDRGGGGVNSPGLGLPVQQLPFPGAPSSPPSPPSAQIEEEQGEDESVYTSGYGYGYDDAASESEGSEIEDEEDEMLDGQEEEMEEEGERRHAPQAVRSVPLGLGAWPVFATVPGPAPAPAPPAGGWSFPAKQSIGAMYGKK